MNNPGSYFSDNYYKAAKKFLVQSKKGIQTRHQVLPNLHTDVVHFQAKSEKNNLLLVTSGVHGIEGYLGSAIQLRLIEKFVENLNTNSGMALVHAVNPFGFANNRRVNENNVDLNRSFVDLPEELVGDEAFESVYGLVTLKEPRNHHFISSMKFYAGIPRVLLQQGYQKLKAAVAGGQYRYPESIFFGASDQASVNTYREILRDVTDGYKNLIHVDLHTGLGKRYAAVKFTDHQQGSEALARFEKIIPDLKSSHGKSSYMSIGGSLQFTARHSKADNNYCMGIDFGTISAFPIVNVLIAENQIHHYPDTPNSTILQVENLMMEAFNPSCSKWRNNALKISDELFSDLYSEFDLGVLSMKS